MYWKLTVVFYLEVRECTQVFIYIYIYIYIYMFYVLWISVVRSPCVQILCAALYIFIMPCFVHWGSIYGSLQLAYNFVEYLSPLVFVCVLRPFNSEVIRDCTPNYCPLRRMWSLVNAPFPLGIELWAVAWQSFKLPLCHASSTHLLCDLWCRLASTMQVKTMTYILIFEWAYCTICCLYEDLFIICLGTGIVNVIFTDVIWVMIYFDIGTYLRQ